MAIKPPDLLKNLPSVSELLDKPPVRALVDKWNRGAVAGGVKSFLDELRNDLSRRAAEVTLPSIRELAERAARYIVSRQQHELGVAINATGRIWGSPWTNPPVSDAALERAMATGREFTLDASEAGRRSGQIESLLSRLSGSQAAAVVHSYSGALWLALSTIAVDREVIVARADVGDVGETESLPKLAEAARTKLIEVGTIHSAPVAVYETAATDRTAAVLKLSSDTYRIIGQASAELEEIVGLTRDRELVSIDALGTAPLVDPPPAISWPRRSAQTSVAAGADLVVLRGDGLVGGPACGILVGRKDVIGRIKSHPLFGSFQLSAPRSSALKATLECYENPTSGIDSIPVWQILTVSTDNLRNRAERIAPQIALGEGIGSATPIETRSPISAALHEGLPSHGIALAPADGGSVEQLDRKLQTARFPIHGRVEADRLIIDLRTVLPRQDMMLVEALVSGSASTSPAPTISGETTQQ
jgi:L-seryl-tRNA(Ser) seleniumtransferase